MLMKNSGLQRKTMVVIRNAGRVEEIPLRGHLIQKRDFSSPSPTSLPPPMDSRYEPTRTSEAANGIETPEVEGDHNVPTHTAFHEQKGSPQRLNFQERSDNTKSDGIAKATGCKLTAEATSTTMGVKICGNNDQCADGIGQLQTLLSGPRLDIPRTSLSLSSIATIR